MVVTRRNQLIVEGVVEGVSSFVIALDPQNMRLFGFCLNQNLQLTFRIPLDPQNLVFFRRNLCDVLMTRHMHVLYGEKLNIKTVPLSQSRSSPGRQNLAFVSQKSMQCAYETPHTSTL